MIESLQYPPKNKKKVVESIDIYSLGMILPTIICDISDVYEIKKKQLLKCFSQVHIQNQLSLLKDMTQYHSKNRIDIEDASPLITLKFGKALYNFTTSSTDNPTPKYSLAF